MDNKTRQQQLDKIKQQLFNQQEAEYVAEKRDKAKNRNPTNGHYMSIIDEEDRYLRSIETAQQTNQRLSRRATSGDRPYHMSQAEYEQKQQEIEQKHKETVEQQALDAEIEERLKKYENPDAAKLRQNRHKAEINSVITGDDSIYRSTLKNHTQEKIDLFKKFQAQDINKQAAQLLADWENKQPTPSDSLHSAANLPQSNTIVADNASGWPMPNTLQLPQGHLKTDTEYMDAINNTINNGIKTALGYPAYGALKATSAAGDLIGLDESAKALDHYLAGSGEDRVFSKEEVLKRPEMQELQDRTLSHFHTGVSLDRTKEKKPQKPNDILFEINKDVNYFEHLKNIKDGETIPLPIKANEDKYSAKLGAKESFWNGNLDESQALGSKKYEVFTLPDTMRATRHGNKVTVTGRVRHEMTDKYNFDNQWPFDIFPNLAQHAGAKPYEYRMRPTETNMILEYELDDKNELKPTRRRYEDIQPGQN